MADRNGDAVDDAGGTVVEFETTQRLDPDAFNRAKSRVDGGFERGVEALLTDEAGRTLLVCEDGRWALPGSEVPEEQSPESALKHAVEAETGLTMTVGPLLAINDVTLTDGEREASLTFQIYGGTVESPDDAAPGRTSISTVDWHEELPSATIDRSRLRELLDEHVQ